MSQAEREDTCRGRQPERNPAREGSVEAGSAAEVGSVAEEDKTHQQCMELVVDSAAEEGSAAAEEDSAAEDSVVEVGSAAEGDSAAEEDS